ncbi:hypothetical protein Tco_1240390, partial [Tanacetum coccineum]
CGAEPRKKVEDVISMVLNSGIDATAQSIKIDESNVLGVNYTFQKFLSMVESEKATVKDYTKLVVTDGMVDYVLEKYRNNWKCEDEIAYVILEDLWLKYGKCDKGKGKEAEHDHLKENKAMHLVGKGNVHDIQNKLGKLEVDLARVIKAKQVDDHDDDLDTLDLENRIKTLEEDFGRLLKAKKEELKASEAELKVNEAKKAKEAELNAKKAKEAMLA